MEYDFKDVAEKLVAGGMDEAHVNASITALKDAYASVPDEEILKKIENAGGAEAIASGILKNYGLTQPEEESAGETDGEAPVDTSAEETPAAETPDEKPEEAAPAENGTEPDRAPAAEAEITEDGIAVTPPDDEEKPAEDDSEKDSLGILSIDDDMFSDDADVGETAPEESSGDEDVIKTIEEGGAVSSSAEEFFDDDDVKVKPSVPKPKQAKPQQPSGGSRKKQDKKKTSVKNMSSRAKTAYIIGLVFLIPLLIALVIVITVLFLSLYAAIIALVVASSAALVVIATVGTVLSLMAIIYGVIQIAQGVAVPIGMYEIGLGVVAAGGTLCISILLYNFIVRLAPFLFKKMFVLYKFLVRQLSRLLGFVKGACGKL